MTRGDLAPNTQTPPRESGKTPQLLTEEQAEGAHAPSLSGGGPSLQGGGGKRWWQGSADSRMFPEIPMEKAVSSCAQDPSILSCGGRSRVSSWPLSYDKYPQAPAVSNILWVALVLDAFAYSAPCGSGCSLQFVFCLPRASASF